MKKSNFYEEVSLLGLGAMRLPQNSDGIDYEELNRMVDTAIQNGINYFDTAYVYHGEKSEDALKRCLVSRYDRNQFKIADKMPGWFVKQKEDLDRMFNEQLERLGVDYIDYYLLHSLDKNKLKIYDEVDGYEWLKKIKAEGKAKHIGFSFHDGPEVLEEILQNHPEMDFVQLQINYLDWDVIRSKECYEIARKYNKAITIMEPLKGGTLASLPPDVDKILKAQTPSEPTVSWAFRFIAQKEGIITILSGMSNLEQVEQNIEIFNDIKPLSSDEEKALSEAIVEYSKIGAIPCTGCKYCIDCPKKIDIASIFATYNQYKRNPANSWNAGMMYRSNFEVKANECIECKKCESHCPQFINIIKELKVVHKTLS